MQVVLVRQLISCDVKIDIEQEYQTSLNGANIVFMSERYMIHITVRDGIQTAAAFLRLLRDMHVR